MQRHGVLDSAAALSQAGGATGAPQRTAARFWLGRLALLRGDTAAAEAAWVALAHEDSIGYYGLRARREVPLPPLRLSAPPLPAASPAEGWQRHLDRKSTRLNSSHLVISYAVFCLRKKTP